MNLKIKGETKLIKLAKYLKPFAVGLIIAILLLFGQAMSDLSLPDFMSDIVNVGIQQSGIASAAPEGISQSGMKLMKTFMIDEEKTLVDANYVLVSLSNKNSDGKEYKDVFPKAQDEIFVKKSLEKDISEKLDDAFAKASGTFINVLKSFAEKSGQPMQGGSDASSIDTANLYKMQMLFDTIPKELIITEHNKLSEAEDMMTKQMGIALAKAIYTELGFDLGAMQTGYIIRIGLIMLLVTLLGGVATVLVNLISSKIATGVARNLRKDIFSKVENFSNNEFDKFSTASLITRCTNDVTQIQMLLMIGIRLLCYAPIMGIGGILMALNSSASMSWVIAVAVITLLGLIIAVMSIALPQFKAVQKLIDKLNLVSRENLSGLMVIRAFATQSHEKKRFDIANKDLTKTSLFISRVMVFMMPMMMLIMNGVMLLIVWVGSHEIANSTMQVGDMMAFMQYAMQIIMSFLMISMMFIFVPRASVSADRIAQVLETELTILDPVSPKEFVTAEKGVLEFKDVSFRYFGADEDALSGISFTAMPGQTTAIIGATGSGKSTIAKLALRFYDVSKGQILIDGVDVRDALQSDVRNKIGYVPQKGELLSGTIAFNIKYGNKNATDDEIKKVAEVAQALDFINEKEEGFENLISQGGSNVSGGQKQRLSIARAMAKDPEVLIFDDSFSALDFKTDSTLRKALKEHTSNCTVIIVAQRVSTIMNAEQILVLDNGMIVGMGTHSQLLKSCPQYYEIASSQLTEKELA